MVGFSNHNDLHRQRESKSCLRVCSRNWNSGADYHEGDINRLVLIFHIVLWHRLPMRCYTSCQIMSREEELHWIIKSSQFWPSPYQTCLVWIHQSQQVRHLQPTANQYFASDGLKSRNLNTWKEKAQLLPPKST